MVVATQAGSFLDMLHTHNVEIFCPSCCGRASRRCCACFPSSSSCCCDSCRNNGARSSVRDQRRSSATLDAARREPDAIKNELSFVLLLVQTKASARTLDSVAEHAIMISPCEPAHGASAPHHGRLALLRQHHPRPGCPQVKALVSLTVSLTQPPHRALGRPGTRCSNYSPFPTIGKDLRQALSSLLSAHRNGHGNGVLDFDSRKLAMELLMVLSFAPARAQTLRSHPFYCAQTTELCLRFLALMFRQCLEQSEDWERRYAVLLCLAQMVETVQSIDGWEVAGAQYCAREGTGPAGAGHGAGRSPQTKHAVVVLMQQLIGVFEASFVERGVRGDDVLLRRCVDCGGRVASARGGAVRCYERGVRADVQVCRFRL